VTTPALNARQRAYLTAIFDVDQPVEADMRSMPFSPFQHRPKASEWRWLEYSDPIPLINKPASRLYDAIQQASKIDQGTGSTFSALADRGLIDVATRGIDGYTHIRMTTAGRKLARSLTREGVQGAAGGHPARVALARPGEGLRRGRAGPRGLRRRLLRQHLLRHLAAARGVRPPTWTPRGHGARAGSPGLAHRQAVGRHRLSRGVAVGVADGDYRGRPLVL
jgi:hypothetical protein